MVAENCTTHPLHKAQNLMTHPLSALAHPRLYFLTSPSMQKYCGGEGVHQVLIDWLTSANKQKRVKIAPSSLIYRVFS